MAIVNLKDHNQKKGETVNGKPLETNEPAKDPNERPTRLEQLKANDPTKIKKLISR